MSLLTCILLTKQVRKSQASLSVLLNAFLNFNFLFLYYSYEFVSACIFNSSCYLKSDNAISSLY